MLHHVSISAGFFSGCFRQWVDPIPLPPSEKADLKDAILQVAGEAPHDIGRTTIPALRADLLAGGLPVKRAVAQVAKDVGGREIALEKLKLRVMPIDEEDFATETNLERLLGVNPGVVHGRHQARSPQLGRTEPTHRGDEGLRRTLGLPPR
jgi:hypothetical protein